LIDRKFIDSLCHVADRGKWTDGLARMDVLRIEFSPKKPFSGVPP
jgi:hypothetical protein